MLHISNNYYIYIEREGDLFTVFKLLKVIKKIQISIYNKEIIYIAFREIISKNNFFLFKNFQTYTCFCNEIKLIRNICIFCKECKIKLKNKKK